MTVENEKARQIRETTGLKPTHFADLIRVAQVIFDPGGGVSGRNLEVDWENFDIPNSVANNLKLIGEKYYHESPHVPIEIVWEQLTGETRSWMIENKDILWQYEELFPALDED